MDGLIRWYLGVFTPFTLLPTDQGFGTFSPLHFLWLGISAVAVAALVLAYKHLGEKGRRTMGTTMAWVAVAMVASQQLAFALSGTWTPGLLPLHACNLGEYLMVLYRPRRRPVVAMLLFTLGISGGVLAMVFPGWHWCPPLSWISICGFVEHILLVAFGLMVVVSGEYRPRWRDLGWALGVVALCVAVIRPLNDLCDANWFYVSGPADGSPLIPLIDVFGDPGYLVPYGAVLGALWAAMVAVARRLQGRAAR